jgi:hypothetical protein
MAKALLSSAPQIEDEEPDKGKREPDGDPHQRCLTAPSESANRLVCLLHALGKKA